MSSEILITAEKLNSKSNYANLRFKANDLLKAINDKIISEHKKNHGSTVYSLPSFFSVSGFEEADAQLYIHCYILEELEKAGYKTEIEPVDKETHLLHIEWTRKFNEETKNNMKNYLRTKIKKTDNLTAALKMRTRTVKIDNRRTNTDRKPNINEFDITALSYNNTNSNTINTIDNRSNGKFGQKYDLLYD